MSDVPPESLARRFAEIARTLAGEPSWQRTLDRIVGLAVEVVPGCDAAGVMLIHRGGRVESPAATEDLVREADAAQYELGEGPCLEAIWQDHTFRVDDMAGESRWPRFAPRAVELGVRSMLSLELFAAEHALGALNLFARKPRAFDDRSEEVAWLFASHAAVALASAQESAQLREAIETRQVIGEAMGILMERFRLDEDQAFDVLRRASQEYNTKLREVARRVTETGERPI